MLRFFITCSLIFSLIALQAQVVTYTPAYPTLQDSVEITFNATQGNGALTGVSPVYMHTGVISENSLTSADWKHRINPWPTGDPDLVIDDAIVEMDDIGGNLHRIKIKPNTYYGTNSLIDYNAIAIVFRNQDGSLAGKNADNSDVFIPIFKSTAFDAFFFQPLTTESRVNQNDTVDIQVLTNGNATITVFHDGVQISQVTGSTVLNDFVVGTTIGKHWLRLEANNGTTTVIDSISYIVEQPQVVMDPPFASQNGINYVDDTTVLLQLYAPNKNHVHVIGDFNNWEIDPAYRMNKTTDGTAYWIELTNLTPGQEYRYQYSVDQEVVVADPWAEKYLDEFNDINIFSFTYPNLINYPTGYTHGMVSVFQPGQAPFNWQTTNFTRPWSQDLVIYELLVRDFTLRHDYKTMTDSLDYLQGLGVNVIELMPVNEFDGNDSWGYGPAFYLAPDKYYGPKADLKTFIDECHSRGIAVVLDVVFNHAFSQNSWARLYQDRNSGKPTANNPWFNDYVPHPFGFYNDFDHSSLQTQYFVDRCLYFWLTEYKVDGFRFDLSKGFTQINSYPNNLGLWGSYDADRVNWLKRIYNQVRTYDADCYMILEHFADNTEELELANHGFMLWGNAHSAYKQAALGYQTGSDFSFGVSSKDRNWPFQHLVGFMESHDEERIMYECLNYGNMNIVGNDTTYNIQDEATALKRIEAISAFFYTVPGPKMLWQFGELGYDFSINFNGRTGPKPLRWNYYQEPNRLRLYKATAAMIQLKTQNVAFRTANYDLDVWGTGKRMWVTDPTMNVTVIGNFGVDSLNTMMPGFQQTGQWYDYMTGDTIQVNDVNAPIPLGPGDYHIYTDVKLTEPDLTVPTALESSDQLAAQQIQSKAFPNPFNERITIQYQLPQDGETRILIYDITGKVVQVVVQEYQTKGAYVVDWNGVGMTGKASAGMYFYTIEQNGQQSSRKIIKMN